MTCSRMVIEIMLDSETKSGSLHVTIELKVKLLISMLCLCYSKVNEMLKDIYMCTIFEDFNRAKTHRRCVRFISGLSPEGIHADIISGLSPEGIRAGIISGLSPEGIRADIISGQSPEGIRADVISRLSSEGIWVGNV